MRKTRVSRFYERTAGKMSGGVEQKMQQSTSHSQTKRRVEPIFDASGSLRRHVMSKLDEANLSHATERAETPQDPEDR